MAKFSCVCQNLISSIGLSPDNRDATVDRFWQIDVPGNPVADLTFNYAPSASNDMYYRVKVNSVLNQSVYSNTILLKGVNKAAKLFDVSTFITNQITVNAGDSYQYQLNDINGNMLAKGNGSTGFNRLDMNRYPNGMYILQLVNNNEKQTERIIKQ